MDVQLSLPFPWWYALICLIIGISGAALLYFRSGFDHKYGHIARVATFITRSLVIALICFLFLSPLLKHITFNTQRPDIYIGIDQSASVGHALGQSKSEVLSAVNALKSELEDDYSLHLFSVGEELNTNLNNEFDKKNSDLNSFFQFINNDASRSGSGAAILLSDGIFNKGNSPLFESSRLKMPLYAVAVGDTNPSADINIRNIIHNEIGFTGDISKFQVDIQAFNFSGKVVTITLSQSEGRSEKIIQTKTIRISENNFFQTVELQATLLNPGQQRFNVSVSRLEGESTYHNNSKTFYIDVIDSKLNIDLIAAGPHPDIGAIKSVSDSKKNYDLKIHYLNQEIKLHEKSDLIILYQVPTLNKFNSAFEQIWPRLSQAKTPLLFIVGGQSNIGRFNAIQPLLKINGHQGSINDVYGILMNNYGVFNIRPEWQSTLPAFPPMQSPFGDFKTEGNVNILLKQRIGRVETNYPLWMTGLDNGRKVGIIAAEGLWRWRMNESSSKGQAQTFDEILGNTLRYLSTREDKRKFKVRTDDPVYTEFESIIFSGELYNNNYELVNTPEAQLSIKDNAGQDYNYTLDKTEKAYFLDIGQLPAGEYSYQASVNFQGNKLTSEGRFAVNNISGEMFDLVADHGLLSQMAENTNGQVIGPDKIKDLAELIRQNDRIKPVISENKQTDPLINLKWIFGLLAFLLGFEWFVRRYMGKY